MEIINNNRFKTWSISLIFTQQVNKADETMRHLLPRVLLNGSTNYPNIAAINQRFTALYNTQFKAYSVKIGTVNAIVFSLVMVKEEYGEVAKEAIDLLYDIVYNPLLVNGFFKAEYVNKEKTNMLTLLNIKKQDVSRVPYDVLVKKLFPKAGIATHYLKNETQIKKVTPKSLYNCYLNMFNNQIDVILEEPPQAIIPYIESKFKERKIDLPDVVCNLQAKALKKPLVRYASNYQSHIAIIYGMIDSIDYRNSNIITLFNFMFGGMASSLLFKVVREEHNLAYAISSAYNRVNSLITVGAGVEVGKEKEALTLIDKVFKQFYDLQEDLLTKAKMNLISNIKSSLDQPGFLGSRVYNQKIYKNNHTIEERIAIIESITALEIANLAKSLVKLGVGISKVGK